MDRTSQSLNPKSLLKTITILHFAYCLAILVFGITAIFITKNKNISFSGTDNMFFHLVPLFAISLALLSHFLFQIKLKKAQQKLSLIEKLTQHQTSRIIRYAMLEAPALLGIVIFIITSNQYYLIISAVLLAYLFLLRPTKAIIKEELNLTSEQEKEFRNAMR